VTELLHGAESRAVTQRANQIFHEKLADRYKTAEPHFRPENQRKVRSRLEQIAIRCVKTRRILDIGCGTGFIIDLVNDLFESVDGIDITPAMLSQVDLSPKNVSLQLAPAEEMPFGDNEFDLVTAYSFLDHLNNPREVMSETMRVLAPGGIFYADLLPNRKFWIALDEITQSNRDSLDKIVNQEIEEVVQHEDRMLSEFGVSPEEWKQAEPKKAFENGFLREELIDDLISVGFSEVEIEYDWYLGQAFSIHQRSPKVAEDIDEHLRKLLPLSSHLFKYFYVIATK
jgi:ubiquinone/menaquinone biosynthesis C-methylase UbiE